jgi:hypothetical protein
MTTIDTVLESIYQLPTLNHAIEATRERQEQYFYIYSIYNTTWVELYTWQSLSSSSSLTLYLPLIIIICPYNYHRHLHYHHTYHTNSSRNMVYSDYSLVEVNRFSTKLMGLPNEGRSKSHVCQSRNHTKSSINCCLYLLGWSSSFNRGGTEVKYGCWFHLAIGRCDDS